MIDKLKDMRKKRGVSQRTVADFLGMSQQAYANYENGKREPDYNTLLKIAEYFDVSVDWLLGAEPTKNGPVFDDEANEIMREMYERPELRALFKTSKKATADDIRAVDKLLKHMAGEDNGE